MPQDQTYSQERRCNDHSLGSLRHPSIGGEVLSLGESIRNWGQRQEHKLSAHTNTMPPSYVALQLHNFPSLANAFRESFKHLQNIINTGE